MNTIIHGAKIIVNILPTNKVIINSIKIDMMIPIETRDIASNITTAAINDNTINKKAITIPVKINGIVINIDKIISKNNNIPKEMKYNFRFKLCRSIISYKYLYFAFFVFIMSFIENLRDFSILFIILI